jgi:triosephosphate isomerase
MLHRRRRDAGSCSVTPSGARSSASSTRASTKRCAVALQHGITPIVAVGETGEEHAAGLARARRGAKARAAFDGVTADDVARCVVAYEPIWAIGTGLADSPPGANAIMGEIRAAVAGLRTCGCSTAAA